jgi:hypothetical protein
LRACGAHSAQPSDPIHASDGAVSLSYPCATAAAEQAGLTYSAWLAATARKEFTLRAGLAGIADYEREHGPFTPAELADADRWAATALGQASATPGRKSA